MENTPGDVAELSLLLYGAIFGLVTALISQAASSYAAFRLENKKHQNELVNQQLEALAKSEEEVTALYQDLWDYSRACHQKSEYQPEVRTRFYRNHAATVRGTLKIPEVLQSFRERALEEILAAARECRKEFESEATKSPDEMRGLLVGALAAVQECRAANRKWASLSEKPIDRKRLGPLAFDDPPEVSASALVLARRQLRVTD